MKTNIYALVDPRNDKIRYVGKANDVNQRLKNHLNPARYRPTYKFNWIRKLRRLDLKPYLIILDEVEVEEWQFWEKWWIVMCKAWGFDLVNYTEGGDGLTHGNQTSFKKGNKSWNEGKGNTKKCVVCGTEFKSCLSAKKKSCSKECASIVRRNAQNSGKFGKGTVPWNKGKKYKHDKNK
tara:strand:+ start:91 stop:627 length:537 start_codon:yes stop_codon:yes gene_type:complete